MLEWNSQSMILLYCVIPNSSSDTIIPMAPQSIYLNVRSRRAALFWADICVYNRKYIDASFYGGSPTGILIAIFSIEGTVCSHLQRK